MVYLQRLILFTLVFITVSQIGVIAQCRGTLLFSDEFNGSNLDLTKWSYETGNGCPGLCGWGNNEQEYYTSLSQNVNVTGGNLNLTARQNYNYNNSGTNYTSGKINTKGKFDRLYGRFEASMKMPLGTGMWPAFWLLSTNEAYGSWPTSGEIDIAEYRGDITNRVGSTLHYGNGYPQNLNDGTSATFPASNFSSGFHSYAVEWEPGVMRFYVDNSLFKTERQTPNSLNPASNNAVVWPWDKQFYIILNLAIGGWYTGNPTAAQINAGTTFPQSLQVDYVRVYDMNPNATQVPYLGTALPIPGKVEAEYYNVGCNTFAYNDTDVGNTGNVFRSDDVDIEVCTDGGNGYSIGYTAAGEWLNYDVFVNSSGAYDIQVRVASATTGRLMHLELDGVNISGSIAVPNTGGWAAYQTVTISNINLTYGAQLLKVVFDTPDVNLNYVNFALVNTSNLPPTVNITSPSNGATFTSPAVIQIDATASDPNGTVSKVEFYIGTSLLTTDINAPYSYTINGLGIGTYNLKVVAYDNELATSSQIISITVALANSVDDNNQLSALFNVFPNPFTDESIVELTIDKPGYTSLVIYNNLGQEVTRLIDADLATGTYQYNLSETNLSSQIYTCILQNNGRVVSKKIIKY